MSPSKSKIGRYERSVSPSVRELDYRVADACTTVLVPVMARALHAGGRKANALVRGAEAHINEPRGADCAQGTHILEWFRQANLKRHA